MQSSLKSILHENESIIESAEISKTFYSGIVSLYALGVVLLFLGYEYNLGVIGLVLVLRTFYMHMQEIQEKKYYHCVLTQERIIIQKGKVKREVFPIELKSIRTIYIKPVSERFKKIIDVGALEVLTKEGGRYVINDVKRPYEYHRAIIGDVVSATNYKKMKQKSALAAKSHPPSTPQ